MFLFSKLHTTLITEHQFELSKCLTAVTHELYMTTLKERERLTFARELIFHCCGLQRAVRYLSFSCVLCLFRQVQASNDDSLLYHKLFSLYDHIPRLSSSSSLSSYHSASNEFLPLLFCLLTLYAEGIHFSTHDLTNFTVFVGWCSSSFCFPPPCPKPLDWIGVQSNWFSLTFSGIYCI